MQTTPNGVAQDLLSGNARIGLASLPLDVHGIICQRRFSAPLVAALPESRAAEFPRGRARLIGRCCGRNAGDDAGSNPVAGGRIQQALQSAGLHPTNVIRANSSISALQFTRLLGATAIVEPVTAFGATPRGVILRPLADQIPPFTFGFFAAEGTTASREASTFFDYCEAALFELVPNVRRLDAPSPPSPQDKV